MDDDIVLRKETLEWGFQQFAAANPLGSDPWRGRIVGFAGRDFKREEDGTWKYKLEPQEGYSFVLSNAAWFRKEWLEAYWSDEGIMPAMRAYVDEVFNCDDLLVNYLVSSVTSRPPLLLQPKTPLRTIPSEGLWNRAPLIPLDDSAPIPEPQPDPTEDTPRPAGKIDHFLQRDLCLAYFFDAFQFYYPAPPLKPGESERSSHWPLVRAQSAATQDLHDHARWILKDEPWEAVVWLPYTQQAEDLGDGDDLSEEEEEELRIEMMMQGMDDEELDAYLKEMEEEDEATEKAGEKQTIFRPPEVGKAKDEL